MYKLLDDDISGVRKRCKMFHRNEAIKNVVDIAEAIV